ncbi:MAG: protein phosphatase 2C domain-containing protein, partial [Sphingomonadales bacterium]
MVAAPAWRIAGASVTGAYHALRGDLCQDRHRLEVTPGGALIAVVSDGAGSAVRGGEGASILCEQVTVALAGALGGDRPRPSRALLRHGVRAVCAGIEAARSRIADAPSDYHATLVGAVVLPGEGGLFFHIGDGAALALESGGGRWALSAPRNGEYSHETYFFTENDWRKRLRFTLVAPDFDTIFVMTDGVTDVGLQNMRSGPEP